MLFPKSRMRFTKTVGGKSEPGGYIVLDLAGFELEGIAKLTIPVADLEALKAGGDLASEKLKAVRSLLGGNVDAREEADEA